MLGIITTFGYSSSSHSTYRVMASNNTIAIPSVCLPRVYHKFDANYVEGIFCELFGPDMYGNSCVEKVDMVSRTDRNTGEPFHVVFIHFSDHMYYSDYLSDFAARIGKDEEVKVQYNPPWFWKVRKNKAAHRKEVRTGPRIMSRNDEAEIMAKQQEIVKARHTGAAPAPPTSPRSDGMTPAEARLVSVRSELEAAQKLRKDTNEEMYKHEAELLGELNNGTKWVDLEDEEEDLNRLKEEADKDSMWPPPLEWGEDADVAEAR